MSGYYTVVSSVPNVIFVNPSTPLTIKIINTARSTFTMNSFLAASAWNDNLNVYISGLLNGVTVHTMALILQVFTRTNVTLNWSGIDTVTLTNSGGTRNTNVAIAGNGAFVGIDNMLVTY